jgi:hypothetical protein
MRGEREREREVKSMYPAHPSGWLAGTGARGLEAFITSSPPHPSGGAFLANAMLLRGDLSISDVNVVMARLQPTLNMVHFNRDGAVRLGVSCLPRYNYK